LTPEYFVKRWSDPQSRPLIKGRLIDETGRCSAQGDVLRCAGFSEQQLRAIKQTTADREAARLLGISLAESMLIRIVNDSTGRPQDVFQAPEKVLGPHHKLWTAFAKHLDRLRKEDWERVAAACAAARSRRIVAAWAAARAAAGAAAWDAAGKAAWEAAREAAGTEAREAAGTAAWAAARELVGWSELKEPFFLRMFFDDPRGWVESIEDED